MNLRAIILDVYGTLLEIRPAPRDASQSWDKLCARALPGIGYPALGEFVAACERETAKDHARARALGIPYPEVNWLDVAVRAFPALGRLRGGALDRFLFEQNQLIRGVRAARGAMDILRRLHERGVLLGIASNAQAYTLRELKREFRPHGLAFGKLFRRDLVFWSFENGFSKPDPHVFRILTARLAARGLCPDETLMVGDRTDKDILPAAVQGWHTWRIGDPAKGEVNAGNWPALGEWLRRVI
jgi:FMN phosphatase YigB (HAD superfamily)